MVDLTEFEAAQSGRGASCTFAITKWTPEQRAKLDAVLDTRPDITTAAIVRVLASWEFKVSDSTVSRHRKRRCSCPKPKPNP